MTWKGKNVLITGVSGFVGPYLSKYLACEQASVYGFFRRRADAAIPKRLARQVSSASLKLIEGDLEDISTLASALRQSHPDVIFHLASQSFIPRSFSHPMQTHASNSTGTLNLLEAVRQLDIDPTLVFAGSSEEYGLVIASEDHLKQAMMKYGTIFPAPAKIPELPVNELNSLRPMSPYAATKVYGDFIWRVYHHAYGMKTIVSRAFNHEGARRGHWFVTANIASQVMEMKQGDRSKIVIGDVNSFRDWSHIEDAVRGYSLIAIKGIPSEVYNQGSQRTHSVLTYILLSLEIAGYTIEKITTLSKSVEVKGPTRRVTMNAFGSLFETTEVDRKMLVEGLVFRIEDQGIIVQTDKGDVLIEFSQARFRPADVPILMCDNTKIHSLGFQVQHTIEDIIRDQLDFYLSPEMQEESRLSTYSL